MSKIKGYTLNPETLLFEQLKKVPLRRKFLKSMLLFLGSIALALLYFWIYTSVLKFDTPKTAILKWQNTSWNSKLEVLNANLDGYDDMLQGLETRDAEVYRSIFGLNDIPQELLHSGIASASRYDWLDGVSQGSQLRRTAERLDHLTKEVYVNSKSFDEVGTLSKMAGDMASCIPAIPPINPGGKYHIASPFGHRTDPVYGGGEFHKGVDFATDKGTPIYATGDGVVDVIKYEFNGYGNQVIIDHGFGYKTRYAHMNVVYVAEGIKLKRGDCIGEVGSTGKSTGPHVHYEVLYKDTQVDPAAFYDLDLTKKEYEDLVRSRKENGKASLTRPSASRRR
ncbi:MAG: M23 family metallopeptidase [Bacteroidales bacterium]|nr:M23 family metallopeptidase [Bacteroidales bacterium]